MPWVTPLLRPVFLFCLLFGLPLHITGSIHTPTFEWVYMVNYISGASAAGFTSLGARVRLLEFFLSLWTSLDVSVAVAPTGGAVIAVVVSG